MFVPSSNPHHPHHQHHYSLKLKSMFELALASSSSSSSSSSGSPQQQHQHQQHHHHHLLQQQLLTSSLVYPTQSPYPLSASSPGAGVYSLAGLKPPQGGNSGGNNNNSVDAGMESVSGGGAPLGYPISPQSSHSAVEEEEGSRSPGIDLHPGRQQQQSSINFLNQAHHQHHHGGHLPPSAGIIMSIVPSGSGVRKGEGGMGGKKQGPGSGAAATKPSFSIESLLAHSNSWRSRSQMPGEGGPGGIQPTTTLAQQQGLCGKTLKEGRFNPYPAQAQQTQGGRSGGKSGGTSCTSAVTTTPGSTTPGEGGDKQGRSCENSSTTGGGKGASGAAGTPGNAGSTSGRRAAKSKRVRTIFTPEQLERLEAEFERQQYMVGPERLYLASSLYLTEAQVKVWFQNRRIKWRKQHLEMEQQRLAIYRTLAEQDMLAGAGSSVPPGDGLTLDDDEDTSSSRDDTELDDSSPVDEDSSQDRDYSDDTTTNLGEEPPKSCPSPQPPKSNFGGLEAGLYNARLRVPLQHHSFNRNSDDFLDDSMASSYNVAASNRRSGSPSSPTMPTFPHRRTADPASSSVATNTPGHAGPTPPSSLLPGLGGSTAVNK